MAAFLLGRRRGFALVAGSLALLSASVVDAVARRRPEAAPARSGALGEASEAARPPRGGFTKDGDGWVAREGAYEVRATARDVTVAPRQRTGAALRGGLARFETVSVGRGAEMLQGREAAGHVEPDGRLSLRRGDVAEELSPRAQGVEQSWRFAARPEGSGDLVVRVRVSGQAFAGETRQGVRFADPTTRFGLQYGHGTWIDGEGRRTPVRARYEAGEIELRVAAAVVERSAYPAVLDPIIGLESPVVEYDPVHRINIGGTAPQIAFGQTGYLVVWNESDRLYGRRTNLSGEFIDLGGFRLNTTSDFNSSPTFSRPIAVGGNNNLFLWVTHEPSGKIYYRVHGALISHVGPDPILEEAIVHEGSASTFVASAAAAFLGNQYLVVWVLKGEQVFGKWIDADAGAMGAKWVEEDSFEISPVNIGNSISAACREDHCLVAWADADPNNVEFVSGAIVGPDENPTLLPPLNLSITPGISEAPGLDVEPYGDGYLLAFEASSQFGRDIHAVHIPADGEPINPPVMLSSSGEAMFPAIARTTEQNGEPRYVVSWINQPSQFNPREIVGVLIGSPDPLPTEAAKTLDEAPVDLSGQNYGYAHSVACTGMIAGNDASCAVVSWIEEVLGPTSEEQIVMLTMAPDITVVDDPPLLLSQIVTPQTAPTIAYRKAAKEHVVAWHEGYGTTYPDTERVLQSARVAQIEPSEPAEVSAPAPLSEGSESYYRPGIACSMNKAAEQETCLVVYTMSQTFGPGVAGRLINDLGPSTEVSFSSTGVRPAVAYGGSYYLVTWHEQSPPLPRILAARVGSDGSEVSQDAGGIPVVPQVLYDYSIVYDGDGFLVVWEELSGAPTLRGKRIDASGAEIKVIDESFLIAEINNPSGTPTAWGIASDGEGTSLVVWVEKGQLRATRFNSFGSRLDEGFTLYNLGPACCPKVVFDGNAYLVAWTEQRDGVSVVRGTWVGRDGSVLEPEGFDISSDGLDPSLAAGSAEEVAMSSDGEGSTLVAFRRSRFEDSEGYYDSDRLRVRFVSNPCYTAEPPIACTETGGCMTAGACNPVDLTCTGQVPKPDGTSCFNGLCVAGACVADPALSSSSSGASAAAGGLSGGADPEGCGCRAAGSPGDRAPLAIALLGLAFGLTRRRAGRSSSRSRYATRGARSTQALPRVSAPLSAPCPARCAPRAS